MKLSKVSITPYPVALQKPFAYFLDTLHELPYARVVLETNMGTYAKGEVACALDSNGESVASAMALQKPLQSLLYDMEVRTATDIINIMNLVELHINFNAALKCGLEQALFGLLAQAQRQSVAAIFNRKHKSVAIQATVPFFSSKEEYLQKCRELCARKPEFIKFKVGNDSELEAAVIQAVAQEYPHQKLSIDANQAFPTAAVAGEFLNALRPAQLAWAEQMIPKNAYEEYMALKRLTDVPLMADEAVQTAKDARLFLQNGWADMINLKLAKCGGVIEARRIIATANEYHVPVMLGSMIHSELGLAYNLAFALSSDFVTHDFYSYFSLKAHHASPLIDAATLRTTNHVYL